MSKQAGRGRTYNFFEKPLKSNYLIFSVLILIVDSINLLIASNQIPRSVIGLCNHGHCWYVKSSWL